MTQEIINAVKAATERMQLLECEAMEYYNHLEQKNQTEDGLDAEENEQHGFEDGFSSAMRMAMEYLTNELAAVGVTL